MRRFNSSGACDPEKHYTIMRQTLVSRGETLVDQGRYFTIFAPRQAGKTTYFQLLFRQLVTQSYTPIWINFESLKTVSRDKFYYTLNRLLHRELGEFGIHTDFVIQDQIDLQEFFERIYQTDQRIVLVIDEFEDIPDSVRSEVMHALRALYQQRRHHGLHSVILVGVSTVAELVVSSASPFNVVDELKIPYFTFAQTENLIQQYVTESGQPFKQDVIHAIYSNTQGQPGLIGGICQYLVEEVVTDRSKPITMDTFYPTLKHFLTARFDKNILNIVQKAREKQDFMLRVLFDDTPIPFTIDNPDIAYLYAHGVIDNVDGEIEIVVPLYSKRLITAFRPHINGEAQHYLTVNDTFQDYLTDDGLNLHAAILKYREYIRRRGFRAFDTEQLKEGAWHYSLDGFLHFFIERVGGDTFIEVPTGRGRTDILILYQSQKYIVETKIYTDEKYFQDGKYQLADYLDSEQLQEGYYVVFSNAHSETDTLEFDEEINGKRIFTYIIRTNFEQSSRKKA